jgi:hypothetical protein
MDNHLKECEASVIAKRFLETWEPPGAFLRCFQPVPLADFFWGPLDVSSAT